MDPVFVRSLAVSCSRQGDDSESRGLAAVMTRTRNGDAQGLAATNVTLLRFLAFAFVLTFCAPAVAGDVTEAEMRSLDERVQTIKSDVLEIAAELTQLEEKLLYPSNTQVAVFVSLEEGHEGEIDSVQIEIDGQPVAHHIYTFKELEALDKGGVQRLYTGNLKIGEHRLAVSVTGKLSGGREVVSQQDFTISKEVKPKLVGLRLGAGASGELKIELGDG